MALIKYYSLESRSWEDVSALERNLQKHLLGEKRIRGILGTDVEDVAKARDGNGDEDSLAKLLYDSGDFDVLYRTSWEIAKGKERWFKEDIPPRVGTNMVIRATSEDIFGLQDYLGSSGFELVESRAVSRATFSFGTRPCHHEISKSYEETLNRLIKDEFEGLRMDLISTKEVKWGNYEGGIITGIVSGDVVKTLQFRNILKSSASSYGTIVFQESVTFSQ